MSKDILGSLLRVLVSVPEDRLGLVQDIALKLSNDDGEQWVKPLKQFLRKEACWVDDKIVLGQELKPAPALLEWNSDLYIPFQKEFDVAKHFTTENKEVKFYDIGSNFQSWFMPMTEKETSESVVGIGKLQVKATFADMTPELGESRIMTVSQLYWMLQQQPKGEKSNGKNRRLLTNGYANLLRVLDKDGVERAVHAYWHDGYGWYVNAYELEDDFGWDADRQVISRKSSVSR